MNSLTRGAVFDVMVMDPSRLMVRSLRKCELAPSDGGLFS
jgi:hypothetical protein